MNFPEDSAEFSYAQIVYWQGYDPDGRVAGFEYFDDTSQVGLNAYRAGNAQWEAYLASIPASSWSRTNEASRQIFLLTDVGVITEHLFMVRSLDNLDVRSPIAVRTYFRSNLAPNAPRVRWSMGPTTYETELTIADTLLMGDTLTVTYSGLRLLWQGSDPDSRTGNLIPLEFSYAVVRLPADTVALPVYDDSNRVVGYRAGWSDWGETSQIALYGFETGDYVFSLRVRDDGLTLSDTISHVNFHVIKPTFHRTLLIVDENKALGAADPQRGGIHPDTIMKRYWGEDGNGGFVRDAFDIAEILASFVESDTFQIPPFVYDTSDDGPVMWYSNRTSNPIPVGLIQQFRSVWIIDDDNVGTVRSQADVTSWEAPISSYLDVGGTLMWSGRRLFHETLALSSGAGAPPFVRDYFGIYTVRSKQQYSVATPSESGTPDFAGASSADPQWPDLEVDTSFTSRLRYFLQPVACPPEIEFFGRSSTPQSFDFATTVYNYVSCTAGQGLELTNIDCSVDERFTTPTVVCLIPQTENLALLNVTRIRNVTRGVDADFINVANLEDNPINPIWRIYASIPFSAGVWTDEDVLEVDYYYIPLSDDHDEPIGVHFVKYEGTIEIEQDGSFFRTRVTAGPRYRTALFTFPLSYLKNDTFVHPLLGPVPRLTMMLANELVFFQQNLNVNFENDRD
ncbi:hypothetical protein IT157_01835 [bacterium]|nr:hypothetical protein [bacterium]